MAKLSAFTRNATAMTDGTEVKVGPEKDRFSIVVRGMTDAYTDRLWALRQLASVEYNASLKRGDVRSTPQNLPPSLDDRCVAQALGEKCLLDVHDLDAADGTPVTVEQFREMLLRRENVLLLRLTLEAVASVGFEEQEQNESAEKN